MSNTLTYTRPRYLSCAETAKLVRAALKREFPGVKFSVRSSEYSGGASIRIHWVDGPTSRDVDKVVGVFAGADFDGSIDLKTYSDHWLNPDGTVTIAHAQGTEGSRGYLPEVIGDPQHPSAELVSFGADYVFTDRDLSDTFVDEILWIFEYKLERPAGTLPRDQREWHNVAVPLHVDRDRVLHRMVDRETAYVSDLVYQYASGTYR